MLPAREMRPLTFFQADSGEQWELPWRCLSILQLKKYSNVASLVMDGTTTNAEMIKQADKLFVVVGAISLMTLLINGMTSSPLLSAV